MRRFNTLLHHSLVSSNMKYPFIGKTTECIWLTKDSIISSLWRQPCLLAKAYMAQMHVNVITIEMSFSLVCFFLSFSFCSVSFFLPFKRHVLYLWVMSCVCRDHNSKSCSLLLLLWLGIFSLCEETLGRWVSSSLTLRVRFRNKDIPGK